MKKNMMTSVNVYCVSVLTHTKYLNSFMHIECKLIFVELEPTMLCMYCMHTIYIVPDNEGIPVSGNYKKKTTTFCSDHSHRDNETDVPAPTLKMEKKIE